MHENMYLPRCFSAFLGFCLETAWRSWVCRQTTRHFCPVFWVLLWTA